MTQSQARFSGLRNCSPPVYGRALLADTCVSVLVRQALQAPFPPSPTVMVKLSKRFKRLFRPTIDSQIRSETRLNRGCVADVKPKQKKTRPQGTSLIVVPPRFAATRHRSASAFAIDNGIARRVLLSTERRFLPNARECLHASLVCRLSTRRLLTGHESPCAT